MTEEQLEAGARAAFESFTSLYRDVGGWGGSRINEWQQLPKEVRAQWRSHVLAAFRAAAKLQLPVTVQPRPVPPALVAQADEPIRCGVGVGMDPKRTA